MPTSAKIDEIGYIPFDPQAANLMFRLVSSRYERASMIVSSNKAFSAWGEIFGDEIVAVAMIDRLIHHAEILSLSVRLGLRLGLDLAAVASRDCLVKSGRNRGPAASSQGEWQFCKGRRMGEELCESYGF